jgi:hypothetical protein
MPGQVKPLGQLTKHPANTSSANPKSGKSFIESPQPHSEHSSKRSKHYQERVIGTTDTGQYGDRAVTKLNPTKIKPNIRSFPGLAN